MIKLKEVVNVDIMLGATSIFGVGHCSRRGVLICPLSNVCPSFLIFGWQQASISLRIRIMMDRLVCRLRCLQLCANCGRKTVSDKCFVVKNCFAVWVWNTSFGYNLMFQSSVSFHPIFWIFFAVNFTGNVFGS